MLHLSERRRVEGFKFENAYNGTEKESFDIFKWKKEAWLHRGTMFILSWVKDSLSALANCVSTAMFFLIEF